MKTVFYNETSPTLAFFFKATKIKGAFPKKGLFRKISFAARFSNQIDFVARWNACYFAARFRAKFLLRPFWSANGGQAGG